jgi:hypothetical protein
VQVRIIDGDLEQTLATVDTLARAAEGPIYKPGRGEQIVVFDPLTGVERLYYVDQVTHRYGVMAGRLDLTGIEVRVRLLRPSERTPNPLGEV